jgi:hypothetical protein
MAFMGVLISWLIIARKLILLCSLNSFLFGKSELFEGVISLNGPTDGICQSKQDYFISLGPGSGIIHIDVYAETPESIIYPDRRDEKGFGDGTPSSKS